MEKLGGDGGFFGEREEDLGGGSVGLEELGLRERGVPGFEEVELVRGFGLQGSEAVAWEKKQDLMGLGGIILCHWSE